MKHVVVIGGGTGVFTLLSGLKEYPYHLSAIVSMADNGGSTGLLREEFGVLPPGDIRRALIALSRSDNKIMSELFNYRFSEGTGLKGHSMGNLLITALERITGSFPKALKEAVKILNVQGEVVPVTLESAHLCAELEDGEIIRGETNIDIPQHDGTVPVKRIFLDPEVSANPDALKTLQKADFIILGPGDLYTSILPNLLVKGIVDAIRNSRAKKIYVTNIMTKFGETNSFKVSDFVKAIKEQLGEGVIDYCVVNVQEPAANLLERYKVEKDEVVKYDKDNIPPNHMNVVTGKFLRRGQFLRHDPAKISATLSEIIEGKRSELSARG